MAIENISGTTLLVHRSRTVLSRLDATGRMVDAVQSVNYTLLITGMLVIALAEVFRHGLALKEDVDLTV